VGGLHIATIRGVPIRLHWSLLVALPLFALVFGARLTAAARLAGLPSGQIVQAPVLWGFGLAIALFLSVLVHELAHTLYALRHGGRVRGITLLVVGGVSQVSRPPEGARNEALMALVGPVTSLSLGALFLALHFAAASAGLFNLDLAIFFIGWLNLVLGVFNLLPAFPMDGGRVLRAALIPSQGRVRATLIASWVGRGLAVLLGLFGLLSGNLWLVLIAFFVYAGAEGEFRSMELEEVLGRIQVRQIMGEPPTPIPPDASLAEAADRFTRDRVLALPVVADGDARGVLQLEDVQRVDPGRRGARQVGDTTRPAPEIGPDDYASGVLQAMSDAGLSYVPVIERGSLVGMLGREDIARAVRLQQFGAERRQSRGWLRRRESST
jgi:Zn-dependent protease